MASDLGGLEIEDIEELKTLIARIKDHKDAAVRKASQGRPSQADQQEVSILSNKLLHFVLDILHRPGPDSARDFSKPIMGEKSKKAIRSLYVGVDAVVRDGTVDSNLIRNKTTELVDALRIDAALFDVVEDDSGSDSDSEENIQAGKKASRIGDDDIKDETLSETWSEASSLNDEAKDEELFDLINKVSFDSPKHRPFEASDKDLAQEVENLLELDWEWKLPDQETPATEVTPTKRKEVEETGEDVMSSQNK